MFLACFVLNTTMVVAKSYFYRFKNETCVCWSVTVHY